MTNSARTRLVGVCAATTFLIGTAIALAGAGSLTFVEQDKNGVGGVVGLDGAIDVAVAPGGANVYAVGTGSSAVVTFTREPTTGALTFLEQHTDGAGGVDGIGGARGVAVSADGKNVYVTGHTDGAIATFTRDPGTGALTFLEQDKDGVSGVDGLAGAWGVAVSPNDASVYAAGDVDNAVVTFSRDPGTGALSFVELEKDGVGGVDGLGIATGVAVSPNNANVYVASCGDSALGVFSRDSTTGALTFLEQQRQGVNGVDGLACARAVAIDGNGANVYVAAESGDDIASFSRSASTGALTFIDQDKDGVGGVEGLDGARDVTVSPDCASVYAVSTLDDSVVTLGRDQSTGALTFFDQVKDGVGGVDGIDQAVGVAVSPNNASVYATGEFDDAVATFSREAATTACTSSTPTDPTPVDPTPTPVDPGGGPAARTITLAASKKKVRKGKKVTLSGSVSSAPQCTGGQAIVIERMPKGKKEFSAVVQATSAASGAFSAKAKVKKTTQFRATAPATSACAAAESATAKVKAKRKRRRGH
jgi:6-phosphogluconolactonase (cycloisomerase 2 family)